MVKIPFYKPWESAIAVLEDNIFYSDARAWANIIAELESEHPDINKLSSPVYRERRKEPRFAVSIPVHHRLKGSRAPWHKSESLDVSQNGVRLAVDIPVNVGSRLNLELKLPNVSKPVRVDGVVVWQRPSFNSKSMLECGVAFETLRKCSQKDRIINFMADKLCWLALRNSYGLSVRPALTREELLAAYHLVYRQYLQRGYCEPNSAELHYNFFCALPESRTFLLIQDKKQIVGTISLIVDSPCGLAIDTLFSDKLAKYRKPGRKLAEVSLLALDSRFFGQKSFALTNLKKLAGSFLLFKIMFDYARTAAKVTDLIIAMHPKHQELYRYLTFEAIGPVRNYAAARHNPALLMRMDIERSILSTDSTLAIHKYFVDAQTPASLLGQHFVWSIPTAWEFLCGIRDCWSHMTPQQQSYVKICYPGILEVGER
ncbi:MAG: PilZ domain-containing protein [Candidatus Omnitrophica bacterium]|nr:PilZ domain-containing protein [Candidatus Omnitrophota bacterium]